MWALQDKSNWYSIPGLFCKAQVRSSGCFSFLNICFWIRIPIVLFPSLLLRLVRHFPDKAPMSVVLRPTFDCEYKFPLWCFRAVSLIYFWIAIDLQDLSSYCPRPHNSSIMAPNLQRNSALFDLFSSNILFWVGLFPPICLSWNFFVYCHSLSGYIEEFSRFLSLCYSTLSWSRPPYSNS